MMSLSFLTKGKPMSEEKEIETKDIIQSVVDKKFTKANSDFSDMMRNKTYAAVDNFKQDFKYVTHEIKPEETPKEEV